jgi:hypothetical protein
MSDLKRIQPEVGDPLYYSLAPAGSRRTAALASAGICSDTFSIQIVAEPPSGK